jgi:hypothetical protein
MLAFRPRLCSSAAWKMLVGLLTSLTLERQDVNVPGLNETKLPVINQAIRELATGASNSLSQVTLRASLTTTVVSDPLAAPESHVDLCPLTANAAAAQATTYVSARARGSFTLTHASAASTDRTFSYRISRT